MVGFERLTRRNFGIAVGMMTAVGLSAGSLITLSANAAPMLEAGAKAPAIIDAVTSTGETISLSDFAGKTVVLEWTNDGCPFVKKHYAEPVTNMQNLQADAADDQFSQIAPEICRDGDERPYVQRNIQGKFGGGIDRSAGEPHAAPCLSGQHQMGRGTDRQELGDALNDRQDDKQQ